MGWLADAVAGKFSVIFFSAIVYLVGAILVPIGSLSKTGKYVKPERGSVLVNPNFKKAIYIIGLFLVAFGTGGIKANVSPFGADQVSNKGPQAIQKFFIWFYWFINIGAFISFTLVVWVQQETSYFYGYLIPTCSIFISLVLFISGKRTYNIRPPAGSVLSNTLKIAKEAWKKSRSPSLPHPDVQHWLDRAKVSFGGSNDDSDVENVKKVYRLIPVFGTFVLYWTIYAQVGM